MYAGAMLAKDAIVQGQGDPFGSADSTKPTWTGVFDPLLEPLDAEALAAYAELRAIFGTQAAMETEK
jgi:hypothetical protein